MIIDIHIHEKRYSNDSKIGLEEIIHEAERKGLDGICITDHDSNGLYQLAQEYQRESSLLIIVGSEIFTYEGDVLVFGLNELPKERIHAQDLLNLVHQNGGVGIGAHPYRENNRGIGDQLATLNHLSGVEAFNGRTEEQNNLKAFRISDQHHVPQLGGSDAHELYEVGNYATRFCDLLKNESDFIQAVKLKRFEPVVYANHRFCSIK
jgi:predicted metal-dependent phosphoesterase TrpH